MPEGFGPETITMAVAALAGVAGIAAEADFFADAAEVGAQFVVVDEADLAFLQLDFEADGEFLFYAGCKNDRLDFVAELFFGALGQLRAQAAGVDTRPLDLAQSEQAIKRVLDFGEGAVEEFDAEAVPDDVADLLADVEDAEIFFAGDVEAQIKLRG